MAFGIGVDLKDIRRIIHIGVPYTMEEYFQEIGRAGRDGLSSTASLYYNSYDLSKRRKEMSTVMRDYVTSTSSCRREMILKYFGYSLEGQPSIAPVHKCCDYHKNICTCNVCSAERVKEIDLDWTKIVLRDDPTPSGCQQVNLTELCNELTSYWLDIDYGRSCIGSTSLSSGFSIELINLVCSSFHELNSLDDIITKMPVFTTKNADAIWEILKRYK